MGGNAGESLIREINERPNDPNLWNQLGASAVDDGDLETALTCFTTLVALVPESAVAWDNLGRLQLALGNREDAISAFQGAVSIEPLYKQARLALTETLLSTDPKTAAEMIDEGIKVEPECLELRLSSVKVQKELGNYERACREALVVLESPTALYEQILSAAGALLEMQRLDIAVAAYAKAIELDPSQPQAFHGFGVCHQFMGSIQVAKEAYETVLKIKADSAGALKNLSVISANSGDYELAIEQMRESLRLAPNDLGSVIQLQYFLRHVCDWSEHLDPETIRNYCNEAISAISPFQVLPLVDDPSLQLSLARRWDSGTVFTSSAEATSESAWREKVRVGWFGNDFHDHATLFLLSGLFREYDRSLFEFFVYSYGMIKTSPMRSECERNVDMFLDVAGYTDSEIRELARSHDLDIAIDLKAFTNGGRISLFQDRVAPIQINYLGYPGTSGSRAYDYLVGDNTVVPPELDWAYSETILRLPHSYQPNDSLRPISDSTFTRESEGLPEDAFVFCSFNNTYKISPREFDLWMSLLRDVDNSVLWLLEANAAVAENLRSEATSRGVDASRLIFAGRLPVSQHLARHALADLFLDTFNVNAHTTASDALWSGLPMVTLPGQQFAARVAASLLNAVGLPELIAKDEQHYVQIAKGLARNTGQLTEIRQKLIENRDKAPLFDTVSYTRSFEQLMLAIRS